MVDWSDLQDEMSFRDFGCDSSLIVGRRMGRPVDGVRAEWGAGLELR